MVLQVYQCKYCEQTYVKEASFQKHTCIYKTRHEQEIKTVVGQLAYQLYIEWLCAKYGNNHSTIDMFIQSKHYTSFYKFAKFVKSTKLHAVDEYIKYMVDNSITPPLWVDLTIYGKFLKHYEKHTPVNVQIEYSIKHLFKLADEYECDISDIFEYVYFDDIYNLIIQRKLSPILLFKSKKFHKFVLTLTTEQQNMFDKIIDFKFYKNKLNDQKLLKYVNIIIKELNI